MVKGAVLLVRADANAQIGSGHFMRCLALAQVWQERGGTASFLMAPSASGFEKRLEENDIGQLRLSSQPATIADAEETAAVALRQNADWVVLDGYQFSPNYQRGLKDRIEHLLLFDDLATSDRYHADLLLNQNAYATTEMYGDRARDCALLLGASYFLLRREFRELRHVDRQIHPLSRNLLVTFGGSDPENSTAVALKAMSMVPPPTMNIRVLVGASNSHRAELEKLAGNLPHSVEFQTDSRRMADEMAWADLAISAAGSTSWELAFMGLPSLLITLSENQHGSANYLHDHGIAISLGWHNRAQPAEIASAVRTLATDSGKRAEMSSRGRGLIDGRGADRIIQAITAIAEQERGHLRKGNG